MSKEEGYHYEHSPVVRAQRRRRRARVEFLVVLCWVGWLVGRREIGRQSSVGSADDRERPTIRGEEICWQCFVQREMNEVEKGTTVLFACVFPSSFLLEAITEYQESSLFFAFSSIERERRLFFLKGQWSTYWQPVISVVIGELLLQWDLSSIPTCRAKQTAHNFEENGLVKRKKNLCRTDVSLCSSPQVFSLSREERRFSVWSGYAPMNKKSLLHRAVRKD